MCLVCFLEKILECSCKKLNIELRRHLNAFTSFRRRDILEAFITLSHLRVSYGTRCHYMFNFYSFFSEIFTTKRSLKDLLIEGIKSGPPPIQDLAYHPCNFWNVFSLYCFGSGGISPQSML